MRWSAAMVDRRRIVRLWGAGGAQALVTLVRVEGSSYRRPGAHLLIGAAGECAGTISGGCLEAEVVRRALWMVRAARWWSATRHCSTTRRRFPLGWAAAALWTCCWSRRYAGVRALVAAMEASLRGEEARVATWLPAEGRPLRRAVIAADGAVIFRSEGLDDGDLDSIAHRFAAPVECDCEVYVETLSAPQRFIVLGAGEDAKPVVTMASLLGWSVTVADGRAQLARAERFAEAERVLPSRRSRSWRSRRWTRW
jgi:xanthine dehydrogenase accessory factor